VCLEVLDHAPPFCNALTNASREKDCARPVPAAVSMPIISLGFEYTCLDARLRWPSGFNLIAVPT
jgi:hypothetical protein